MTLVLIKWNKYLRIVRLIPIPTKIYTNLFSTGHPVEASFYPIQACFSTLTFERWMSERKGFDIARLRDCLRTDLYCGLVFRARLSLCCLRSCHRPNLFFGESRWNARYVTTAAWLQGLTSFCDRREVAFFPDIPKINYLFLKSFVNVVRI